ncbi:MAG: dihydroneopterin aldolase [Cumulibacter sp.]
MSDEIRLVGLKVTGHHGVFEHERRDGQPFIVDCTLGTDTTAAASQDDLSQTVDYGDLAERLAGVIGGEPVDLIETLAHRLLDIALSYDRVLWAEIVVHKPQAPIARQFADVAVRVRRERS